MIRQQRGFTLIELLVVIAIIAILAAILFPVFAQARAKARQIACLSNIKQINTGLQMYVQDYDERLPTSWAKGFPGDPMFFVQPYLKNVQVLECPSYSVSTSAAEAVCGDAAGDPNGSWELQPGGRDNPTGEPHMWGYGFNVGVTWFDGNGLMTDPRTPDLYSGGGTITEVVLGKTIQVQLRPYARPGVALPDIAAPATCLLGGDTIEPPLSSIQLQALAPYNPSYDGNSPCYQLLKGAGSLRHTGGYNYSFVDGHAKFMKYSGQPNNYSNPPIPAPVTNLCMYFRIYDGGNNPGNCQTNGF
jgi:prepilin-type N-terminal cleavage/methylation domain-containing protein/prepilin-type processing-associated H-X9-DG protein